MRVRWTQCITHDPDMPPEHAFIERRGEAITATGGLLGNPHLVVACDDGKVREVDIQDVTVEGRDAD